MAMRSQMIDPGQLEGFLKSRGAVYEEQNEAQGYVYRLPDHSTLVVYVGRDDGQVKLVHVTPDACNC